MEPGSRKRRPAGTASSQKACLKGIWKGLVDLSTISNGSTRLTRRRGDPPAQLKEGQQALPTAVAIVLTKIVVSYPHPQVSQSYFQQCHDLILCVIEFVHLSRLRLQILLSPEYLPQFPTVALTFVQEAKALHRMLFQFDFALAHLPVCRELPCF